MAVFDATKPLRSEQVGTRAPREHSLLRSRKRPQLAQSGRIRLREKLGDLGSEGTAAFDPHSLLSRHTAYGQLRSLKPARRNVSYGLRAMDRVEDSWVVEQRVGWCAMSRGGQPWRGLLII